MLKSFLIFCQLCYENPVHLICATRNHTVWIITNQSLTYKAQSLPCLSAAWRSMGVRQHLSSPGWLRHHFHSSPSAHTSFLRQPPIRRSPSEMSWNLSFNEKLKNSNAESLRPQMESIKIDVNWNTYAYGNLNDKQANHETKRGRGFCPNLLKPQHCSHPEL